MAKVTVKQLAETVKVPVDRLLKQMQEAGLSHSADDDVVAEEEKQQLLAHLQKFRGDSQESKKKITLKRKSTGTIKQGQGRAGNGGRCVAVDSRCVCRLRRKHLLTNRLETGFAGRRGGGR